ncbi:MAG: hypothetical protein ABWY25_01875, partial [Paenisporosarcina sp.]
MTRKKKRPIKKKKTEPMHPLMYEIIGLLLIGLGIITFFEYGFIGFTLSSLARFLFGNWHVAVSLFLLVI